MDEIVARIAFGVGRRNDEPVDHRSSTRSAMPTPRRSASCSTLAADQLGTVGSGNHYVDLFDDEEDFVWVGVHFGSRGFGHKTATRLPRARRRATATAMDGRTPPTLLLDRLRARRRSTSPRCKLAGEYAYAGRDVGASSGCSSILGAAATD